MGREREERGGKREEGASSQSENTKAVPHDLVLLGFDGTELSASTRRHKKSGVTSMWK